MYLKEVDEDIRRYNEQLDANATYDIELPEFHVNPEPGKLFIVHSDHIFLAVATSKLDEEQKLVICLRDWALANKVTFFTGEGGELNVSFPIPVGFECT
jgi:hypothetical protein